MTKAKEFTIFNNYDLDEYIEAAKEWFLDNGNENPTDEELWEEAQFMNNLDWEEAEAKLKEEFDNGDFLAVGTCGLWYGNFDGGFIFSSFSDMMSKFADCDYIKFYEKDGHFHVEGTHHDGSHHIEVKRIAPKGKEYYDNWNYYTWKGDKRTEKDVHKTMFKDSHYTHLIRFVDKYY